MNKIQIISFIKEEELTIKATEMSVTKEIKQEKKRYYRIADHFIELIYLDLNCLSEISNLPLSKATQRILLLKEITFELQQRIYSILQTKDILIFIGHLSEHLSIFPTIIKFEELTSSKKLNLNLLIYLLNQSNLLSTLKSHHSSLFLLTGETTETELVSTIVTQTLNQLSQIETAQRLKLYLFTPFELSLIDLADIEDPINEYLMNPLFEIEQFKNVNQDYQICYAVVALN